MCFNANAVMFYKDKFIRTNALNVNKARLRKIQI